jgi:hypothetical protein
MNLVHHTSQQYEIRLADYVVVGLNESANLLLRDLEFIQVLALGLSWDAQAV